MTALLDRVPLEQISADARQARFSRVLLTVIAAVLIGLAWLAARTIRLIAAILGGVWLALAWCFAAVRVGWRSGWESSRAGA